MVTKKKHIKKTIHKKEHVHRTARERQLRQKIPHPQGIKMHRKISVVKPEEKTLRNEKDIAMDFATKVHQKFDTMVKATVLFGSSAKKDVSKSDIDVAIIIDDASIDWDLELISWYREELAKIVAVNPSAEDLHVNTIKLTTWWHDLLHGDPVIINMVRYGEALIDFGGFFNPLKALLIRGKMHSTPEAVYMALQRAPSHLARSMNSTLSSFEGIYWSMVDSAQAALMTAGKMPPSPEHVAEMLRDVFVDKGLLKMDYVQQYRDVFSIHKSIAHGERVHIAGGEIDDWREKAEQFMKVMAGLIDKLIDSE